VVTSTSLQNTALALEYLSGGGEMGARTRALDWSKTAIGPFTDWPQSLRSAVSLLLPSKAQIILFWGPEFVVFYNDAYRPVFGAKHPQALGLTGREAWSEIWDSVLHELLAGVVRTGEAFHAKDRLFLLERNGFIEETYFDVSYDPVRDESGRVGGVFCIVTETTGRVYGERQLALLRDLAARNAAARTVHDACVRAMETLAAQPEEIPFALVYLDDTLRASTPDAQTALLASRPEHTRQLDLLRPAGAGTGKLRVGLNPRRPDDERYQSFLSLVASQISTAIANAEAYENERSRAESLAELDRAKTAFFSNVSHEFRTPLTLMLGPIDELLARGDPQSRELLSVVQRNGQRLLKLVNVLLDFARIEAGRTQASYRPTDVAALTADLASNFRAACDRAGLRLEVLCRGPVRAWVDQEMWEKIVLNLLSNAFKFTLAGSITVTLAEAGERFRLSVADTGIGMPHASLDRVFDRFHRVEGARGRSHEGSGIGLALVQELVKLHGGSIGVTSELGRGTVFMVEVPLGNTHLPRERLVEHDDERIPGVRADTYVAEALGWLPGTDPATPLTPLKPPVHSAGRVLIADDNADLRDYVGRLLSEHFDVEVVSDGEEALEAARARRPDVIVTDVMMPNLDGFGLIRALREDPDLRTVPVLVLSARAGEEARLEGLHRGADDYLVKPFSARELQGRVAALRQSDDIRRRALEALRQSSAQVKALLDHAPLGAFMLDADFRICEVNPVALPAFGNIPGGVHGRDFAEVMRILWEPQYAEEVIRTFRHTLETGESYHAPERAEKRRDRGVVEYYEWRIDPIPQPDGRNGVVCYFRDISAQVLARKALEYTHEKLREADRRKNEFLATLSHELRNPLAPLRNALQIMRHQGDDTAAMLPLREIMERQLNSLVRLVDDLLEMSRITSGTLELRRERVELSAVVRNAVETSAPVIQSGQHRLDISLPGEALWIEGDPVRLAQILSNLLNNAAKYTPEAGSIAVDARRDGETLVIGVRDNGIGIAADGLARIFEMFSREGRDDVRAQGGLGIGLTLSRRLAEMHGGSIEARSPGIGLGAEFLVRLPLASAAAASATQERRFRLAAPMHVLIVDDNRDAASSLGMLLRMLGVEVTQAHDGPSAIEAFAFGDPAVVLLDIGMPGMDGYEVARTLRARYPNRRPAIVALTGWAQEDDRRKARDAGIDYHLVKPADLAELQELLTNVANNRLRDDIVAQS
jgi:PAS domain S-box-containing protein